MIYVTSDLHAYQEKWIEQIHPVLKQDDIVFAAGDFGIGFLNSQSLSEDEFYNWLSTQPYTLLIVDGNHECFDKLELYPLCNYCGGKAHKIRENIYHLCRGEIFDINGLKVFVFGGGLSLDKARRIPGRTWFPQEMPSEDEYSAARVALKKHGNEVDYIITHTCPYETVYYLSTIADYAVNKDFVGELKLSLFLENVCSNVKYKRWYFGHFHIDRELWRNQTAVFNCIRELETGCIVKQWDAYERF